jgi:hypothetical protein
MWRYTLTLPRTLSDGAPTPHDVVLDVEENLRRIGGGFTRTDAVGSFTGHPDEPVTVYTMDTADEDAAGRMQILAAMVAIELDQEAVYVTVQEIQALLVRGTNALPTTP